MVCPGVVWLTTANVSANDFQFASALTSSTVFCDQFNGCFKTRYLYTTKYGFNIPLTSTVTGILAEVRRFSSTPNSTKDSSIMLINPANNLVGMNKASNIYWNNLSSAPYVSYGGTNDLWGTAWTPSDINNNNFGLSIKAYNGTNSNETIYIDHVRLTVYFTCDLPSQPTSVLGNNTVCFGSTQIYSTTTVPGATSYSWSLPNGWVGTSPSNTISAIAGSSGNVSVAATNTCNTSAAQSISVIVNPLPVNNASSSSSLLCAGQSSTLSAIGANTYTWSNASNSASILITPSVTTSYTISGTDMNGCVGNTVITQNVVNCTNLLLNQITSESLVAFPNPFSNQIFITNESQFESFEFIDAYGKTVRSYKSSSSNSNVILDTSELPSGIYLLIFKSSSSNQIKKNSKILT